MEIDREYLGQLLLEQGFKTWFLYMFRVLEGRPFKVEPIHDDMFQLAQDVLDQKIIRANENVPPRSAKTTMCKYIVLYTFTVNPKANFIYTSFNQGLLADISKELAALMENPIYRAMYPQKISYEFLEASPVDDFWRDYFQKQKKDKENVYTNRRITTAQGGSILFAAIGSQITGYGAGIRGGKGFTGALIIDDANKPADIYSQTMRDKVLRYFEETLLSRLNDSDVLIFNIQQRLHIEDLSGHLKRKYGYYTLSKPLLDINGVCQIPSQYKPERIAELQKDQNMFQAQYQQEPTAEKGRIIKRDWWQRIPKEEPVNGQLIITADTAFKETKTADYSCIQVWELRKDKMIMRDMYIDKWEFPELIQHAKFVWNKWTNPDWINRAKYFFIEDKASGTPLQQTISNEGINAIAWRPQDFDYPENKVARTKMASWDVLRGLVYLIEGDDRVDYMAEYLITESSLFAEDMSHTHDDACFVATTMVATDKGNKEIKDIKIGDYVITPFGKSKVIKTHVREKPVISNIGLTGTYDHKVYCTNDYSFDNLQNMEYNNTSKLTFKELAKWASDIAFYLTETSSILTQRQDITKLRMTIQQKNIQQKGFIGRCISFIQEKKFPKVIMYTIRTAIKTITLWRILSCYHIANMLASMVKKLRNVGNVLKCGKQMREAEKNAKNGIIQRKGKNGIQNTKNNISQNCISQKSVLIAAENSTHPMTIENKRYAGDVETNTSKENYEKKQKVYNITTEAGVYYANGILVSNCDAFTMAHSVWKYYGGGQD